MSAWYDGYEVGAMSAKSDGMGDANRVYTRFPQPSNVDYSNMSHSHSQSAPPPSEITDPTDMTDPTDVSEEPTLPPAPMPEPKTDGGPQTRRSLREVLQ